MASSASIPPRRRQKAITIRSDRAQARLAQLVKDGRSRAEIIEEALDRMPLPHASDPTGFFAELAAIQATVPEGVLPSMAELDARYYDEHGLPR